MQKELIFGSEEWIEELNNRVKFPKMFSFYYGIHKETKASTIQTVILDTKSMEPRNIKFSFSPTLGMALSPYKWLVIDVYHIESAVEYLNKMKELGKYWDVELFSNK